ncbi:MAG: zf-TFIIB domain-containing protein [Verrucomicrobiota bacterium]
MKCPACHRELTERHVGQLRVDVCAGGCGGVWFDTFEPGRIAEETESAGEGLAYIPKDRRLRVDLSKPRHCPRCVAAILKHLPFAPGSRASVDECPDCGGCWMEDGELAQLEFERSQRQGGEDGNKSDSGLIAYLYEVRTGRRKV